MKIFCKSVMCFFCVCFFSFNGFAIENTKDIASSSIQSSVSGDKVPSIDPIRASWKCRKCGSFSMDGVNTCPYCGTPRYK